MSLGEWAGFATTVMGLVVAIFVGVKLGRKAAFEGAMKAQAATIDALQARVAVLEEERRLDKERISKQDELEAARRAVMGEMVLTIAGSSLCMRAAYCPNREPPAVVSESSSGSYPRG